MPTQTLTISVSVNQDDAICDMFDIVEDLNSIIEMVPSYQQKEALACKKRIVDKMVDWIDAKES